MPTPKHLSNRQLKTRRGKDTPVPKAPTSKHITIDLLGDVQVPANWVINKSAKGLTVSKILQHTRTRDRRDISKVSYKSKRISKWMGLKLFQFKTITHAVTSGGSPANREHTVTVIPTEHTNGVILDCDCADFVFGGAEYSLAWHGAAFVRRGNGKPPVEKFPHWRSDYFACKHCIRVLVDNKNDFK